ncbi:uncharacterized protein LOC135152997 [Daucus carota subsp. sativus]|uniref:uncharacterized protein LOC135152997 n=1 Tax=Daucus carota subsp. sativus TaxID=79200 RepID=UPI0030828F02
MAARKEAEAKARGETTVGAIVQADASKEKTPEVGRVDGPAEKTSEVVEVSAVDVPRKRNRPDGSSEVRPYAPEWSVLSTDSIAILAPDRIKDVAGDFCRSQILPADRGTYESATALQACEQLMCFLSLASPWAAAVTDKVQDMQKQMAGVNALTIRANLAEDTLAALKTELDAAHQDLKDVRESEGRLKGQVDTLTRRVQRRNLALKAARKKEKKAKKLLEKTEDRFLDIGYDEAVRRAHKEGLDHKLLLDEGASDPVGRDDPDEPLVVSSDPETDYSE